MKHVWILERRNETTKAWEPAEGSMNYYRFMSLARAAMKEADDTAIAGLKETVDCSFWTEEVSDMFRKVHDGVKASFRIGQASVLDESKDWKDYSQEGFQENIGVMNFLWNTKKGNPKGIRN